MNQEPIFTLNEELGIEVTTVPQNTRTGCFQHGIRCDLYPIECRLDAEPGRTKFMCGWTDEQHKHVIFFTRENYFRWAAARLTNLNSKIET